MSMTSDSKVLNGGSNVLDKHMSYEESKDIKPGKQISYQFEDEVLLQCENINIDDSYKLKSTSPIVDRNKFPYPYSTIKKAALIIYNKEYWDGHSFIKKWHNDARTRKLKFTNKWVTGMLRRQSYPSNTARTAATPYFAAASASTKVDYCGSRSSSSSSSSSIHDDSIATAVTNELHLYDDYLIYLLHNDDY